MLQNLEIMKLLQKIILLSLVINTACTGDGINVVINDSPDLCSDGTRRVRGEGGITSRTLTLDSFHSVTNLQGVNISISQGNQQKVVATGHANIINRLQHGVIDGGWTVLLQEGCYSDLNLALDITLPTLKEVISKSSGDISLSGFSSLDELSLVSMGSGQLSARADFGEVQNLLIDNRGSGILTLYTIESLNCHVISAGSGDTFVHVRDSLEVEIRGSGNVRYRGMPVIAESRTGNGNLINAN